MLNEVRRKPEKPRIRQVKTLRPAILGGRKYDLSWECSGAGVMTLRALGLKEPGDVSRERDRRSRRWRVRTGRRSRHGDSHLHVRPAAVIAEISG